MSNKWMPFFHTLATIVIVDAVLIATAWVVGSASIDGVTLFCLGLAVMLIGYLLDSLLFGKYRMKGKGGYIYESSSKEKVEFDQFQSEEGKIGEFELQKSRRHSELLLNISLAGIFAMVLSFILPKFF